MTLPDQGVPLPSDRPCEPSWTNWHLRGFLAVGCRDMEPTRSLWIASVLFTNSILFWWFYQGSLKKCVFINPKTITYSFHPAFQKCTGNSATNVSRHTWPCRGGMLRALEGCLVSSKSHSRVQDNGDAGEGKKETNILPQILPIWGVINLPSMQINDFLQKE